MMNTGGTAFSISGVNVIPGSEYIYGSQNVTHPTIPWTSGWVLEIGVASRSGTVTVNGDSFLVEIMD
jgi:hypothetical protein